jgi:VWFA-related protein
LRTGVLAGSLALVLLGVQAGSQTVAQQAIPDAPRPQPTLPGLKSVTPGAGTSSTSAIDSTPLETTPEPTPAAAPATAPAEPATAGPASTSGQPALTGIPPGSDQAPTIQPAAGSGSDAVKTIKVNVNAIEVPFTVKDSKGRLVPGLMPRDVQVYENGSMQHISLFTSDAFPLSVALVIDQSMTRDEMDRVNAALGALQDAFTKYDEITVFTYNKSPKVQTDFTAAQSARLTQAIERSKGSGEDALMAGSLDGPMAHTNVINNQNFDPNTDAGHGLTGMVLNPPKEIHALNDAILAAATALSNRPIERRRVIYVISDGKEYGSKAKTSQVIKYLLTNNIEVDGTLVGETALWGLGTLDRMHLPLQMRDNVLTPYANATGGNIDAEFRTAAIEKSFGKIASEARYRYTLVYYSKEPALDEKYRKLEVKVLRPDLTVLAKPGYWPAATEMRPRPAVATQ